MLVQSDDNDKSILSCLIKTKKKHCIIRIRNNCLNQQLKRFHDNIKSSFIVQLYHSAMEKSGGKLRFLFIVLIAVCSFEMFTAYRETDLRHFEPLYRNLTKHVNFDKLRIKKVNRTHTMFLGEIEVFQSFGNNYQVVSFMYKSAGNDYKLLPFKLGPDNWCEFLKTYREHYDPFVAVSDFPKVEDVSFQKF